ncbi:3-oxoacyl-ACP reductase [Sphingobium amiense]|uniref:3-oxoacyl-ACP reductase n=1 Tax=Sphingobium amiense TaxID=135719 RepID=A0A494W5I1_9SPHN|nr:glucose 1-dehydrogenase [Sphingobium amiense]BBD98428.1 3-oxoacyl-ACP reductase [Sphingobium amiense]
MTGRIEGKVALITGGASGMGLATVELFLAEGAKVVVADVDEEGGGALAAAHGDRLVFARCDVTVEADVAAAVDKARSAFGTIDIMFNNAAFPGPPTGILDMTTELWDRIMNLVLRGPMLGIKHAAAAMKKAGGGAIVNTASVAALEYGWGPIAYSTAKAAVLQLTRCAAAELAEHGIRVNAICPGVIATPIFARYLGLTGQAAENARQLVIRNAAKIQPLRQAGLPEDIARACLFLSSAESRFMTGTHLVVDGGLTVGDRHSWDPAAPAPVDHIGFTPEVIEKLNAGEMP